VKQLGYSLDDVNTILNKKSGMLGLTGFSDMRDVQGEIKKGNEEAKLAYEIYAYHIKKYIGAFAAVMNGVDALIFTAGVGENDALTRSLSTKGMEYLGVHLDAEKNNVREKGIYEINKANSRVKILIVPTNEELEIARQCHTLLSA
jgi:acetate kinase